MTAKHFSWIGLALLPIIAMACSDDAPQDTVPDAHDTSTQSEPSVDESEEINEGPLDGLYSAVVTEIVIEVDYETGAEPYFGNVPTFGDLWDFLRSNLEALFSVNPRTITVPGTLEQMEEIGAIDDDDYSQEDILALVAQHRDEGDTTERRTFYVLFLDGYFFDEDDGGRQPLVIGISLGDTGVIAMFKPVITSISTPRFVEQSTLAHELGHAFGLVDNGVTPSSDHEDPLSRHHCVNTDCVMFYENEGAADAAEFVRQFVTSSDAIVFDQACLNDTITAANQ